MKINVGNYADFKAVTNTFTTPKVLYSVVGTNVHAVASFNAGGFPYASGVGQIDPTTTEATLLVDFPTAVKVVVLSVA